MSDKREPTFVLTHSNAEFQRLLPTRSVEQLLGAVAVYDMVLIPALDTPGIRAERQMLVDELAKRGTQ